MLRPKLHHSIPTTRRIFFETSGGGRSSQRIAKRSGQRRRPSQRIHQREQRSTKITPRRVGKTVFKGEKKLPAQATQQKTKKKRKETEKNEELQNKRNELGVWLAQLSSEQRSFIKEVIVKPPKDVALLRYLQQSNLIQCPNKFCNIFFETIEEDPRKVSFVLGEDGKALTGKPLADFAKHRFKCHHCHTQFCKKCHVIPYHLGFTCEEHKSRKIQHPCRVCKKSLPPLPDNAATPEIVCESETCQDMVLNLCRLQLSCNHPCNGTKGLPCLCLRSSCIATHKVNQTGYDFCGICWTDELESGTCIRLSCGHVFHRYCVEQKLKHKWTGARISFNFATCPVCIKPIESIPSDYAINNLLRITNELQKEIKLKALHFLKAEGMLADLIPGHRHYGKPVDYALEVFSFYMCHRCKLPYYGGKRQCGDILSFNPEELICGGCSGLLSCTKHGKKYIHYKCRFCCSMASWFCFGLVHYCERCHENPYEYWGSNNVLINVPPQCEGKDTCRLGLDHPPNGFEEMSLGCSKCKLEEAGMIVEEDMNDLEDEDFAM